MELKIKRFTAYRDMIYMLKTSAENAIDFGKYDPLDMMKRGTLKVLRGKKFTWKSKEDETSDCPFYIGALPIFQTDKLGNSLSLMKADLIPIEVDGVSYTIVGTPGARGALNMSLSDIKYFSDGKRIMYIKTYVFNNKLDYDFPPIFFLEEYPMFTFCTFGVYKRLRKCGFDDFRAVECRDRVYDHSRNFPIGDRSRLIF